MIEPALVPCPKRVQYRKYDNEPWKTLSDTYENLAAAATIATALENRGFQTTIIGLPEPRKIAKSFRTGLDSAV